jgi:hypothetical protein
VMRFPQKPLRFFIFRQDRKLERSFHRRRTSEFNTR